MDGWVERPSGWNQFDASEWSDDIIEGDLAAWDDYDHIMVLAGGLDHLGRNHPWVKDRLYIAYRLYERRKRKIYILGGGTYHKPPVVNSQKFVIHESTMGAKYLIDRGVDPNDIRREWASYDTIANGWFSLVNFVMPLKLNRVLVITSDFHMPRTRLIFDWIYGISNEMGYGCRVDYLEASTKYLDQELMEARSVREKRSCDNLRVTIGRIGHNMEEFNQWFYQEHQAYNCQFGGGREGEVGIRAGGVGGEEGGEELNRKIRETY